MDCFHKELDLFLDSLLDAAHAAYIQTDTHRLARERREQMERACEVRLTREDRHFAEECFYQLLTEAGEEQRFTYRQGLRDGVRLLRYLGALA